MKSVKTHSKMLGTTATVLVLALSGPFVHAAGTQGTATDNAVGSDAVPARQAAPMSSDAAEDRSKVGEYVDDAAITTKVKFALTKDEGLKGLKISVETVNGVVHLDGQVATALERERVIAVAGAVEGVLGVDATALTLS